MVSKKKVVSKKKKPISKKKVVSKKKNTNSTNKNKVENAKKPKNRNETNETNETLRDYPEIDPIKEIIVIDYVNGVSVSDIAIKHNKGRATIYRWFHEPLVAEAIEKERSKLVELSKGKTFKLIEYVYDDLMNKAMTGDLTFREGLMFLEKTGYLQTTQDKAEQDKRLSQLADQLYNELNGLLN